MNRKSMKNIWEKKVVISLDFYFIFMPVLYHKKVCNEKNLAGKIRRRSNEQK